jgi:hypothetical protein
MVAAIHEKLPAAQQGAASHTASMAPATAALIGSPLLPAATQLMLAAWQRSIALQAEWFEDSLKRARNHRDLPAMQRPMTDWTEPALRYFIGVMALGRSAQDQLVCLTSASLRGAQQDIERLSGEAREQASLASHEAGSATQSAWSCLLQGLQAQPGMSLLHWPETMAHWPEAMRQATGAHRPGKAPGRARGSGRARAGLSSAHEHRRDASGSPGGAALGAGPANPAARSPRSPRS